jgi:menaquinone-dependent protoporphyrinogen oxidase
MSRVLVIYASHYGQTCVIANRIAQRLREAHRHEVDVADAGAGWKRLPAPDGYDAVIVGSRVELGRHAPAIISYLKDHRGTLARITSGFFSVSMSASKQGTSRDPEGYMGKLFADLAWSPTESVSFAGALPYRKYGWFLRLTMKRISKRAGHTTDTTRDHVFTDYVAVAAFADRIAERLVPVQGGAGDGTRTRPRASEELPRAV